MGLEVARPTDSFELEQRNDHRFAQFPGLVALAQPAAVSDATQRPAGGAARPASVLSESPGILGDYTGNATQPGYIPAFVDTGVAGLLSWRLARGSGAANALIGGYGIARLAMYDGRDLLTSRGASDVVRYGLAALSDLAMVGGTIGQFVPAARSFLPSWLSYAGLAGHAISSYLPDSSERPNMARHVAASQLPADRRQVGVRIDSGISAMRPYDVYIPTTARDGRPMPVVFALHGVAGGNAAGLVERETGMNQLAEERGFIAVYPIAKDGHSGPFGSNIQDWNSPGAGLSDTVSGYDDVNYIRSIIDQLRSNNNIDPRALYAIGFSSGGEFAQHLRGRMPGVFAGIGAMHGTWLGTEAIPQAGDQTAFVSILSDSDNMLPASGGRGLMTFTGLSRVAASNPLAQMEIARQGNLLQGPPIGTTDGNIEITQYSGQAGQAPVTQVFERGGIGGGIFGSLWGRGRDGAPAQHAIDGGAGGWAIVGEANHRFDATRFMVDSLLQYRRPGVQLNNVRPLPIGFPNGNAQALVAN